MRAKWLIYAFKALLCLVVVQECPSTALALNNCGILMELASVKGADFHSFYQVGLLVELENGRQVLEFNSYIGSGHKGIADKISSEHGPIKKYLWGGEVEVQFDREKDEWVFSQVNETSGYLFGLVPPNGTVVENKVQNIREFLQTRDPGSIKNTAFIEFDPSDQHLDKDLSEIAKGKNLRHDLRGAVSMWDPWIQRLRTLLEKERLEDFIKVLHGPAPYLPRINARWATLVRLTGQDRFRRFNISEFNETIKGLSSVTINTPLATVQSMFKRFDAGYSDMTEDIDQILNDTKINALIAPIVR